ncbi:MAG: UDP-N-acetyl-D-mannosamine dehydrogenase [Bacteroidota bacterium]|jgi:UDP-N-acetyl-D-mannosaminuronic acid dehydrogenase|uniref:UDP-N-acetyl-D-mannosamine dehydrogenase n=1 Tax=Candidatus Pollutiaquabacter sp. TaxID=3416354 RepID=UPI001A52A74C|nr:UDP-N-acetyl-D-mannosamine dehydrogenase [Bacteroidota bacterium]MBL7948760.1 UDP-N-acetyl-D-mannosamine dehydrogenase [Bacteroidia bacterium]HPD54367.1 UDP-N-acetyl-D-mannosamine dehydrogenase [Bacteroidia bacterium]HRI41045.1 UDP-N-acetyl-D-mannosamine dehydrogenase [Bacteroidia bacterium]HRU60153.1 UDP-N-acetyl-D-mannosamine dehydrogenase [Bacteroidia bacterium]
MSAQVTIMGLGYIGLPTAALIASKGIPVQGVDVNKKVVDTINKGKIHIVEPDLEGLVHYAVQKGLLVASTSVKSSDVFLVAVPTPFKGDHEPDLAYVEKATRMILPQLRAGNLFIIESTSPVGTTEKMAKLIFKDRPELKGKIHIAYCPERVLPGSVIYELQQNDRVIGGIDSASTDAAVRFYGRFVKGNLHKTNSKTAEMCKLVENAYRDVNIAFANELSIICDKAGIDVNELIDLASKHPRVKILRPGPGVGGHCIAVDPWFIVSEFPSDARIIRLARQINNNKRDWVLKKIRSQANEFKKKNGRAPVIACMGLSYKPDIDDLRESPALEIFHDLEKERFRVMAVEPNLRKHPELEITDTLKAVGEADIIVYLVAHKEFRNLDPGSGKIILDFCGIAR